MTALAFLIGICLGGSLALLFLSKSLYELKRSFTELPKVSLSCGNCHSMNYITLGPQGEELKKILDNGEGKYSLYCSCCAEEIVLSDREIELLLNYIAPKDNDRDNLITLSHLNKDTCNITMTTAYKDNFTEEEIRTADYNPYDVKHELPKAVGYVTSTNIGTTIEDNKVEEKQ